MDLRKIKKLMELLEDSGIAEIEVKEGEESIKLSRSINTPSIPNQQIAQQPIVHQQISSPQVPVDVQSTQESPKEEKRNTVNSPMVGTFYASASPLSQNLLSQWVNLSKKAILCVF